MIAGANKMSAANSTERRAAESSSIDIEEDQALHPHTQAAEPFIGSLLVCDSNAVVSMSRHRRTSEQIDLRAVAHHHTCVDFKPVPDICMDWLTTHAPPAFRVLPTQPNDPHMYLAVSLSLLCKLPLLSDVIMLECMPIDSHDEEAALPENISVDSMTCKARVPFDPPGTLWALISVLILLDGGHESLDVTMWLGNCYWDPCLAAQTLEVRNPALEKSSIACLAFQE